MNFQSKNLNVALLLCAAVGAVGCGDDDPSKVGPETPRIAIGALADRTGSSASDSYDHALTLAIEHVNAALDQADIDIQFEAKVADSQSNPMIATAAAVDLINNQGIKGIVTDTSGNTVAVNQLNYDAATPTQRPVPITCYACSSAFINDPNVVEEGAPVRQAAERDLDNWLYRVFFNGKYEAAASVRIMLFKENNGDVNRDGLFKVSVYAQDDAFGQGSSSSIKSAVEELVADRPHSVEIIVLPSSADPTTYDWGSDLERLIDDTNESTGERDGAPDAVFLALLPLLATGAVSAKTDLGYDIPMQAATAFRRNYILRSIGDKAVGLEGDSPRVYADDDSGAAYANAYQERTGDVPEMLSSHVYDCAVRLMLGILKAAIDLPDPTQVDTISVRDQMLSVTDLTGEEVRSTSAGLTRAVTLIAAGEPINYLGASGVGPWDAVGDTFPELVHWTVVGTPVLRFNEEEAYDCSPEHPTCVLATQPTE